MPAPVIAAMVLAAGQGSRMGGGKQLLPWQGKPLLAHTLTLVDQVPAITVKACVLGYKAMDVQSALGATTGWRFLLNTDWEQGQSTSLCTGLEWFSRLTENIGAALILLGDMPLVKASTLEIMIKAYLQAKHQKENIQAVLPQYLGQRGNPVLLDSRLFPELISISGDKGARDILDTLENKILLPVDDSGIITDIDTPEEYKALLWSHHA